LGKGNRRTSGRHVGPKSIEALEEIIFNGLPDGPLTDDQQEAVRRVNEYNYRKMFGLSEAQMYEETMESIAYNVEIERQYAKKQNKEQRIQEMQAKTIPGR